MVHIAIHLRLLELEALYKSALSPAHDPYLLYVICKLCVADGKSIFHVFG